MPLFSCMSISLCYLSALASSNSFLFFTVCCRSNHATLFCLLKNYIFYLTDADPNLAIKYKAPKIFDVSQQHKVEQFVDIFYFSDILMIEKFYLSRI